MNQILTLSKRGTTWHGRSGEQVVWLQQVSACSSDAKYAFLIDKNKKNEILPLIFVIFIPLSYEKLKLWHIHDLGSLL